MELFYFQDALGNQTGELLDAKARVEKLELMVNTLREMEKIFAIEIKMFFFFNSK